MNARRFIAFALSILMLLGTLVACAQTPDDPADTTPSPADTKAPEGSNNSEATAEETTESLYDEEGYLKSSLPDDYVADQEEWVDRADRFGANEYTDPEQNGEIVNDAIFKRNANVEAKMGVKLAWVDIKGQYNSDGQNYANHVGNMYSSGDTTYDIISAHSRTIALTAMSGYCEEMTKLDHLDFEKPWWPKVMLDTATINENAYVSPADIISKN